MKIFRCLRLLGIVVKSLHKFYCNPSLRFSSEAHEINKGVRKLGHAHKESIVEHLRPIGEAKMIRFLSDARNHEKCSPHLG